MSDEEFEIIPENRESLEALGDHLILESMAGDENRTPSGLVIPASAAKSENGFQRFRVIAVGPLCVDDQLNDVQEAPIQPGDLILAPADELGIYREAGQPYYIAHYDQVAAIIRQG